MGSEQLRREAWEVVELDVGVPFVGLDDEINTVVMAIFCLHLVCILPTITNRL
jgi:hypothetical protein